MKSRHLVTLAVFGIAAALLTSVFLKLRANDADPDEASDSAAVDSARAAAQSTAATTAFATSIAVPVEGAEVGEGTFVVWVNAEGEAAPRRSAPLQAEVGGPVVSVPVTEGSYVRAGQLIARIDPALYELDLAEAQGALDQALAEFRDLTLGDDRIADSEVRAEREVQARVRSGLVGAEARLERARYDLRRTEVRAPYAGRVANLVVASGSRLGVGDSVATVVDLSQIDVDVFVLEGQIGALDVGREATVRFSAYRGEQFAATVVTINPMVDSESRASRVTVRLDNPEAKILPGMHASVSIAGDLYEGRTFVPKEAIVERSRRDVVFVFEPEAERSSKGRAKWRYVTTGLENDTAIEIVPGDGTDMVSEGEVVLVAGHSTLTHDARVDVSLRGEEE
ncbi:MAG: efflux RND transporter periplasmic adaptor subunit [Gemmatimonadota bacterium]